MICPICSARNPLGAQRCGNCGHPFTRTARERPAPGVHSTGDRSGGGRQRGRAPLRDAVPATGVPRTRGAPPPAPTPAAPTVPASTGGGATRRVGNTTPQATPQATPAAAPQATAAAGTQAYPVAPAYGAGQAAAGVGAGTYSSGYAAPPPHPQPHPRPRPAGPVEFYGPPPPRAERQRQRRAERRRGMPRLLKALLTLLILAALLAAGLLAATELYVKPRIRDLASTDLRSSVRNEVRTTIDDQLQFAPTGEVVITDADLNQRLDNAPLGLLDSVDVHITPQGLEVALSAWGLDGTYTADLVARDGSVALQGGDVSGPLGLVVPDGELAATANDEISSALADAGYIITGLTLEESQMTLLLDSQ